MRLSQTVQTSILALMLASAAVPALSQSAAPSPDVTAQDTVIKDNLFTVAPVLETELSDDAAVPLEFSFTGSPNTNEAVDVSGITAEGFSRTVSVNGERIAQVVVTRLKKDTDYVDLEADDFTSQFMVDSSRLTPNTAISVNGDEAEFVRAVAQLAGSEPQDEAKQDDRQNTAAEASSVETTGGNESQNDVAGGYQTPERLPVEEEEAEERAPNITFNVSTEGCEHQIDLASSVVRQQSLTQTLEDGTVTETEACAPNGIVWTIQKTYEVCEDVVDLEGGIAKPQYASYYNDDKGARFDVADCQPDTSLVHVITEDFEACLPDLDFGAESVTLLSRKSYRSRSGEEVVVSECAASERSFAMERDYSQCNDFVDLDGAVAHAQFAHFYVDNKASRHAISECRPDEDETFAIMEKEACAMTFDLDAGIATVNTILVYNKDGVDTRVRECLASDTIDPIQMTAEVGNCSLRHDFGAGVSTQMMMWTYTKDGEYFQASPCITTDTSYTHERVFARNGIDVCAPIVDLGQGRVARQYKTEITIDGVREVVAGCQPDDAAELALSATLDGCLEPSVFRHDLDAGLSYGRERFYYESPTQGRVFVTACQESEQTFTHSIEPTNWQYDDNAKAAYQLVDVKISVNGTPYTIVADYLQPGTTATDYAFVAHEDQPDMPNAYYDGCNQMIPTNRSEVYLRPDGTSLNVPVGAGPVANGGDFCQRVLETDVDTDWGLVVWIQRGRISVRSDTDYQEHSRGSGQNAYWFRIRGGNARITGWQSNHGQQCKWGRIHLNIERYRILYPDGTIGYSDWQGLDEVEQAANTNCF